MNEQVLDHCARVYVRGGPEIMASPGLDVPEEPHQPLSFKFPKRHIMGRRNPFSAASKATGLHSGRFYTTNTNMIYESLKLAS